MEQMAENWVLVLMGGTTDRIFEVIIEKDCGLEIDVVFDFLVKKDFFSL